MKKIGLACVGGGVKASSNIGAIQALREANIKIDAISGTSIGSIVAIMYALDFSTEEMLERFEEYAVSFPKFSLGEKLKAPFNFAFIGGLKDSKVVSESIERLLKDVTTENMNDLELPIFIPTLDITNKKTVYYTSRPIEGEECLLDRPISEAIRNTASLPLLYVPNTVYINGEMRQFLDGGMTNNTPAYHLHEFADTVIGIENNYHKVVEGKKVNIITGIRNTFQGMRRSAVPLQKKYADIWVNVECGDTDVLGRPDEVKKCYEAGYNAMKKALENGLLGDI